jgi:hypothetical protein
VAQRFLDKFNALQTATESDRPAATFQNNWGDDIKVEIPETGLKLGDVEKLLRDRLGNVSHVTGDVYKTSTGIAVTARLGDAPPRSFEGSRADLDRLLQQALPSDLTSERAASEVPAETVVRLTSSCCAASRERRPPRFWFPSRSFDRPQIR